MKSDTNATDEVFFIGVKNAIEENDFWTDGG
jgi:hypothetical protein